MYSRIVVLYLHSTSNHNLRGLCCLWHLLYYTFILHQTTTGYANKHNGICCIIPSFYIKPQLHRNALAERHVVLYLHSTSNHNHNWHYIYISYVVLYLHSTSNHNNKMLDAPALALYYTFILHQTTTLRLLFYSYICCIIPSFYIKPQLEKQAILSRMRCIIPSFYIKPQLMAVYYSFLCCCIIPSFYIKPQLSVWSFKW